MVLWIIIALILSSSEPFIRSKSAFVDSDSFCTDRLCPLSADGSHAFFGCRASGILAMMSDVFLGISVESSVYSAREIFIIRSLFWWPNQELQIVMRVRELSYLLLSVHLWFEDQSPPFSLIVSGAESLSSSRRRICVGHRMQLCQSLGRFWICSGLTYFTGEYDPFWRVAIRDILRA